MTNNEADWNPEVYNDFKCLEWKARIQAEILHETEGMTREEVREYFRLASEWHCAEKPLHDRKWQKHRHNPTTNHATTTIHFRNTSRSH